MAAQNNKLLPPASVCIVFDRPDALYRAGEILAGWIDLHLKNDIRVKAMKLHVQGQARVSWDEKRTYTKGVSPTVCYKQSEVILDHQVYLVKKGQYLPEVKCGIDGNGCSSGSQSQPRRSHRRSLCFPLVTSSEEPEGVIIAAGPHRFSFEYILPRNLPSSFEGKWGQIYYGVRFTMERPWKATLERDRTFTVDSVVDFNDEPEIMRPIYGSGELTLMTCCFAGEVYVQMRISRKGFVRGETAPVHVEVYNNSDRTMRDSRISLMQHAIFRAGSRIKKTSTALRSVRQGEIGPDQCRVWDVQLEIPPDVVPSSLRNDDWRGISVRYTISVSLSTSWWSSDWVLPVQIIVGTIALRRETAQRYLSHLMAAASTSTSSLPVTPKRIPESRDDLPPPSCDVTPKAGESGNSLLPLGRGGVNNDSNRKLRGRQSVPCFSIGTSSQGLGKQLKERRASAFELGAIPKQGHERDTATLGKVQGLSSSLDTVTGNKGKTASKQQRLKSVSEEDSDKAKGASKDSSELDYESTSEQLDELNGQDST